MAIVALDKLTVYGTCGQQAKVIDGLQQLGCLHLINLRGTRAQPPELVSKDARAALRYLTGCKTQRRRTGSRTHYDREPVIREVLEIKDRSALLAGERDDLQQSIADVKPWGNFTLPPDGEVAGQRFWFYVIPRHRLTEIPDDLVWHVAGEDNRFAYVVVLSRLEPEDLPFSPTEFDGRPLSELTQRLESVEEELEELYWRRVALTRWRGLLQADLDAADDKAAQAAAAQGILGDGAVFALQGWVPRVATDEVREFAQRHQLAVTIEPPGDDDAPPTLLKNPEQVAGGEGCVTFYITPGYHTWDPSTIVFFSFSLFFAMIVADAGYGLLMGGLLLFFSNKLSRTVSGKRLRDLFFGIVSATVIYGVLAGSYFGVEPPAGTWLDSLRIRIDGQPMMSNQNAMMVIAVAIGVAHLTLANTISAWQKRGSSRSLGHLGWAAVMLGSLLIGTGMLYEVEPLFIAGQCLAAAGAAAILLFSSERPLATWNLKNHLFRLMDGVMQFANVSKAFGDSLSYLRLFALGLASAQLAVTFNDLAAGASKQGGAGLLLAMLILLVGHGINFLLGLMGGVVHGLRLNCIEFFNWSLTEEGYSFQPFTKKSGA